MGRVFCLHNSHQTDSTNVRERLARLSERATHFDIELVVVDENSYDFSSKCPCGTDDAVYNVARGAVILEQLFLRSNPKSVYRELPSSGTISNNKLSDTAIDIRGIQTPKTIWYCTNDRRMLRTYVDSLGGFPLVLKAGRGTRGIGVFLAPNWAALLGLVDYFYSIKTRICLREYIPTKSCERHIVLGDSVVASFARPIAENDFRSDGTPTVCLSLDADSEAEELLIRATHASNYLFGGVNIVTNENTGNKYVLEINCPVDIGSVDQICDSDVAGSLVQWLADAK